MKEDIADIKGDLKRALETKEDVSLLRAEIMNLKDFRRPRN